MSDALQLSNGVVEVVAARDFGPRILAYRFLDMDNVLGNTPELKTQTVLGDWQPKGGHRLWVAPEMMPGSYAPDAAPIHWSLQGPLELELRQLPDSSGIEKAIHLAVTPASSGVTLLHTVTNRTHWPIHVAPWAITIMAPGGCALLPHPPFRSHDESLLATGAVTLWAFSDLSDSRWTLGSRLLRLRPDPSKPEPQKLGMANTLGWCAWLRDHIVMVKRFVWDHRARYPDYGSNNEVYAAGDYLEIETLGALTTLAPGQSARHVEKWFLFRDFDPGESERDLYDSLLALLPRTEDVNPVPPETAS